MKFTVDDVDPIKKKVNFEISSEIVSKSFEKAFNHFRKKINLKGFRKGKVPNDILMSYYPNEVEAMAKEEIVKDSLSKAIEENKIPVAGNPQFDFGTNLKNNEPFCYTAMLEVYPDIELPEYKGLEIEIPDAVVTEEEIDEQIEYLRRYVAEIKPIEEPRALQKGDVAVIDFKSFVNDAQLDFLNEEGYFLEVGMGSFHPIFEEKIVGMNLGETRTVEVEYPDDSINAKIAGKKIKYEVTLKELKCKTLPPVDENFSKLFMQEQISVDELRKKLKERMLLEKEESIQSLIRKQILDSLAEKVNIPIPECLIEEKINQMVDNVANYLRDRGVDFEKTGITEERLRIRYREEAIFLVKCEIIMDKIADKEDIDISKERINEYISQQEGLEGLNKDQLAAALRFNILPKLFAREVLDFIIKNAHIKK